MEGPCKCGIENSKNSIENYIYTNKSPFSYKTYSINPNLLLRVPQAMELVTSKHFCKIQLNFLVSNLPLYNGLLNLIFGSHRPTAMESSSVNPFPYHVSIHPFYQTFSRFPSSFYPSISQFRIIFDISSPIIRPYLLLLLLLLLLIDLGDLGVTCSSRDPRFTGSNPAEVDGFFQDVKILSTSPPGGNLSWGSRV